MDMRSGYKHTEVGAIPDDWKVVDAGSIGQFKGGNGFPVVYQGNTSGEYPFFKVSDMNNEGNEIFMEVANNYISETTRKHLGAIVFPPKTILFAKIGAAVFLERKRIISYPSCIDNNVAGYVISDPQVYHRYIYFFLLNFRLSNLVNATALPSLSGNVLNQIKIPLPPTIAEQEAIAEALSDVDDLIAGLDRLIAKKRDIKQATMQQLLTGDTRLPGFEGVWRVATLNSICSMKSGEQITAAKIDQVSTYACYGGNGLRGFTSRFTHEGRYCLVGRQGALCGNVLVD